MRDADLLLIIAVIVASVLVCTTIFAAGCYQGRRQAQRSIKAAVDSLNRVRN